MIPKYFLLAEIIGYFGITSFFINLLLLLPYYVKLFKQKNKTVSYVWLFINSLLAITDLIMIIMFIIVMTYPYAISGQGKIDENTAVFLIIFAIVSTAIGVICILCDTLFQKYFGSWWEKGVCHISYSAVNKKDIRIEKYSVKYGKKFYKMLLRKSKVGKSLSKKRA